VPPSQVKEQLVTEESAYESGKDDPWKLQVVTVGSETGKN